ncbi:hypothetical protein [Amycolatopsis acidicola]|nr:hypothetical protein [Amycolatopsis acidicola]
MLGRLGMRLAVDPRSAVITIVTLYETMLERAILDELPRLVAALIAPPDA